MVDPAATKKRACIPETRGDFHMLTMPVIFVLGVLSGVVGSVVVWLFIDEA